MVFGGGVRASRGHKSVPVYVGGEFQDGAVCEHGSRGHGLYLSGKGCVLVSRVLQSEQSSLSPAPGVPVNALFALARFRV